MLCKAEKTKICSFFGGIFQLNYFFFSEALIGIRRKIFTIYILCVHTAVCFIFFFAFLLLHCVHLFAFHPLTFPKPPWKAISCPPSVLGKLNAQWSELKTWQHCGRRSDILKLVHAGHIRVQCRKEAVECSLFLFLRLRWPSPSGCPASSCLSITSVRWPGGRQRRHFHVKLACAENRNINKKIYMRSLWVNVASTNGCLSSLVKHKVSYLSITVKWNPNPSTSLRREKKHTPCHLL